MNNNRVARMYFRSAAGLECRKARKKEASTLGNHWAPAFLQSIRYREAERKEPPVPSPLSTPHVSFPSMVSIEATLWHLVISNTCLGGREQEREKHTDKTERGKSID